MEKVQEYKIRRYKRLLDRLDAKNDTDEGRWVTTENDNRVHLNKNGVPDKGNPFVLAAMTGKKPKLSMNYHQKNVSKAVKSGNPTKVYDELLKIPNGSKIILNGEKYIADFGDTEQFGRWVDFVNTEDEDDLLSGMEVAENLVDNGDVSLEAPDRTEKESEPTYEPDVEPENEEYFPDDDIEMPDSPEDYGEVAPQEKPDDVPDEVAPNEKGESNPVSENKKQAYELLKSIMGLKYGDLENGELDSAYDKAKEIIKGIPEGTEISVGGHKFQKYDDSVYPLVDAETGELHSVGDLTNFLHEENNEGVVIGSQEEAPQEQAVIQNDPVSAREKILDLMADAEAGNFVPDNEWTQAFNNLPEGTTLTNKFGSELTLEKDENGKAKFVNQNGVQLKNHKIIEFLKDESYGYKVNVPEETAPQEQSVENPKKDKLQKALDTFKHQNKEVDIIDALDSLDDGDVITVGKHTFTKTKDKNGSFFDKYTDENGTVSGNYVVKQALKEAVYLDQPVDVKNAEPKTETPPSGSANASQDFSNDIKKAKHKKDMLTSEEWDKYSDQVINPINDKLENAPVGSEITLKNSYGDIHYKKGNNGIWETEDGITAGSYGIAYSLVNNDKVSLQGIDFADGGNSSNSTSTNQFNFADLQSEVNKLKKQKASMGYSDWLTQSKEAKAHLNDIIKNAPNGTNISFTKNGEKIDIEKSQNGDWIDKKTGDNYYDFIVANSLLQNGVELESYLPDTESNNSDPYNLGEWNPPTTSNQNAANNTSSNTKSWSGTKANGFGAVQEVKSDIDEFVSKHKSGITISKHILGDQLKKLEDGSSVKVGAKTYVKDTDDVGSITFQNSNNEFDTLEPYQLAAKIASKAQTFDNPIIEVNDPANSPKIKKSTTEPVYIPESIPEPKKADKIDFSDDDFSQERKDAAVWDTGNGQTFDNVMRGISGKVWQGLSVNGKSALYEYTGSGYRSINNFLRKPDHDGQSEEMQHKMRYRIGQITKAISQSRAPKDMWVQRGIPLKNLKRLFGISDEQFNKAESNGMSSLLDAIKSSSPYGQDEGFMSCGSTKGHGFSSSDVILNIYCPKGTQMLYAEPFSAFGNGGKKSWDGTSKQSWFSSENETILQRGTKLVPTKITKSNGKYYVDVEVIGQEYSDKI